MRSVVLLLCVSGLLVQALVGAESDSAGRAIPTLDQLKAEWSRVRGEITALEGNLNQLMQNLHERRHRLEYDDPEIAKIREELVKLERQVLKKREELQARVYLSPEIKKIEEERRQIFQKLRGLREVESAIRRELAAHGEKPARHGLR